MKYLAATGRFIVFLMASILAIAIATDIIMWLLEVALNFIVPKFLSLSLFWKIFLGIILGGAVLGIINSGINILTGIANLIVLVISKICPNKSLASITIAVIAISNLIIYEWRLWSSQDSMNGVIIFDCIFLTLSIISLTYNIATVTILNKE